MDLNAFLVDRAAKVARQILQPEPVTPTAFGDFFPDEDETEERRPLTGEQREAIYQEMCDDDRRAGLD